MLSRAAAIGLVIKVLQSPGYIGIGRAGIAGQSLDAKLIVQRPANHFENGLFGRANGELIVSQDLLCDELGLVQIPLNLLLVPAVVELHRVKEVTEPHSGFTPVGVSKL